VTGGRQSEVLARDASSCDAPSSAVGAPCADDGDAFAAASRIGKRSVMVAGHATSVSLEAAFWDGLKTLAARRGITVAALIAEVDRRRAGNLSSALRVFVLQGLGGRV